MMEIKFNKFQKIVLVIIIFGFLCRLIPHPPNFAPLTAIALFSVIVLVSQIKSIKFGNILLASFLFFLISNFGVWILGYPKNLEGLLLCYTMAIPFFGYSIAGDLFFGYLFKFSFRKISSILPKSAN